jgi:hypothetical protein
MVQNLSALSISLRTVILLKISGVANVSKSEFTLRNWKRSFLDITLRVISDQSSSGSLMVLSAMAPGAKMREGVTRAYQDLEAEKTKNCKVESSGTVALT